MKIVFNPKKLQSSHETSLFIVDMIMLLLVVFNLLWIIFDTMFASKTIQSLLQWMSPTFTNFYRENIFPDFFLYDLMFVYVFLTELLIRWFIAIKRKTYHRWFFYPFVHWYDVLGCIPVGSFRWLRLLRVVSVLYRLEKYQIIDLSETGIYRFFAKYINIVTEEISDRVVVNVLSGVQDELRTGIPVAGKIVHDVLLPKKQVIIDWLSGRVNDLTDQVYGPKRDELKVYLERLIEDAMAQDPRIAALAKVPLAGKPVIDVLEQSISDIAFNILDRIVNDIGHEDSDILVKDLTDTVLDNMMAPSEELNEVGKETMIDIIEVIKGEVKVQKWKLEDPSS